MNDHHPLIAACLKQLPEAGTVWPVEEKARWLRMMDAVLCHLFRLEPSVEIAVENGELVIRSKAEPRYLG